MFCGLDMFDISNKLVDLVFERVCYYFKVVIWYVDVFDYVDLIILLLKNYKIVCKRLVMEINIFELKFGCYELVDVKVKIDFVVI